MDKKSLLCTYIQILKSYSVVSKDVIGEKEKLF